MSVACPCCGHRVFDNRGDYEICPICYWEDDLVQIADPWFRGGANKSSLVQSQRNYVRYGAMEARFVRYVRSAGPDDYLDADWRPVNSSDRPLTTTPREIEDQYDRGNIVPHEYWLRSMLPRK